MRRRLMLCAAAAFVAAGMLASPAQASYRVIKWQGTNVCQIWDYGMPTRPFPPTYRIMSKRLRTYGAALAAKQRNFHRWGCWL
jgi:hypothetical protein